MKNNGYVLVKIGKAISIYDWSTDKEEIASNLKKGMRVLECYKDDAHTYVSLDDTLVAID